MVKPRVHCDDKEDCTMDSRCVNFKHCQNEINTTCGKPEIHTAHILADGVSYCTGVIDSELDKLAERVAKRIVERNLLALSEMPVQKNRRHEW